MSTVPSAAPPAGLGTSETLFVRKATGLVREISLRDTVLLNLAYVSFPLGFTFITLIGSIYPGANVGVAFVITSLLVVPQLLTYGMLASAMPRSGGDYLFIGRALQPLLGFLANAMLTGNVVTGCAL